MNSVTGYLPQAYSRPQIIKGHKEQPAVDLAQDRRREQIIEAEWQPLYGPAVSSQATAMAVPTVSPLDSQPSPAATNIRYAAAKYQQMSPSPSDSRGARLDTIV